MSSLLSTPSAVTSTHQARLAYVYVRQSSPGQVTRHGESTDLQYRLVERAVALGWPRDRVQIIDEDLGRSGASAEQRTGFQHLIAEISLARVGIVLSWDASRLARNNRDWYHLLELCGLFGTLLADGERLYEPSTYHDRLLLGLSGMMSEAELHQLKRRLQAGARHKAERGELALPLPVGYVRLSDGTVTFDPDEEIQARLRLVFAKFAELGSAKAVVRYLQRASLPLPARPLRGPAPHPLQWDTARSSRVLAILKNPAYAGTYVYGRSTHDPTRRRPGRRQSGIVRRPPQDWPICLHDRYPAYLSWDEFMANQARLRDNQSRLREDRRGTPRQGQALLQGIARCGRCSGPMTLHYSGPQGDWPVYKCRYNQAEYGGKACQEVRALAVDAAVADVVLAALAPDQLALALAALDELETEAHGLQRQWQLRLERARYAAQRAERQYRAVEPENRLVARSLERQWETALRAVEQLEHEHQTWHRQQAVTATATDREAILALGQDLPALWHAPTTTPAERKRLLRLVVREVLLDQHRGRGQVWVQINWQTGAQTEHWVTRRVHSYADYVDGAHLQQRVRELAGAACEDDEIAEALNLEGFRTARDRRFQGPLLWRLRQQWGIAKAVLPPSAAVAADARPYSVHAAAAAVGVFPGTVYKWLRTGRVQGEQRKKGRGWVIYLTVEGVATLRDYADSVRHSKKEAD